MTILNLIGDLAAPYALITQSGRAIGMIIPEVVIEEIHHDQTRITDHPVETGAAISDHAFNMPPEVEMRCGFSNSTAGAEGYVQSVYQEFLALKATRQPFDVSTGKRQYQNMLISSLVVTTDETSEFALNIVVGLRYIIITNTTQTAGAAQSAQASPQQTAAAVNTGIQSAQLSPANPGLEAYNSSFFSGSAPLSNFGSIPGSVPIIPPTFQ